MDHRVPGERPAHQPERGLWWWSIRRVESRTSARRSNHPAFWSRLADRESRYNQARSPMPEEAEEFTDGYIYTEETMTLDELPNPNAP